jgi:hypothetical protein
MKKIFLLAIIISTAFFKTSFAIVSGYAGVSAGAVNFKPNTGSGVSGATLGLNAGIEANLLLVKLGAEVFADKAVLLDKKEGDKPLDYGIKGKVMMNLVFVEPYFTAGFGKEKIGDYKNNFALAGVGLQTKFLGIGAYIEANYLTSISKYEGVKTSRAGLQAGLKYYFF